MKKIIFAILIVFLGCQMTELDLCLIEYYKHWDMQKYCTTVIEIDQEVMDKMDNIVIKVNPDTESIFITEYVIEGNKIIITSLYELRNENYKKAMVHVYVMIKK